MQNVWTAIIKCITNHLINYIPSYTVRHAWYRYVLGWYIGPRATILMGQHVHMRNVRTNGKRVSIGAGTIIDHDCLLSTVGGLLIGEHVCISPGAWLLTWSRDLSDPQFAERHEPIIIDDYAWIGARATILGGITIGRGAVVQPAALVTQDVAPNHVVGGVPALVISTRDQLNPSYTLNYRPLFE